MSSRGGGASSSSGGTGHRKQMLEGSSTAKRKMQQGYEYVNAPRERHAEAFILLRCLKNYVFQHVIEGICTCMERRITGINSASIPGAFVCDIKVLASSVDDLGDGEKTAETFCGVKNKLRSDVESCINAAASSDDVLVSSSDEGCGLKPGMIMLRLMKDCVLWSVRMIPASDTLAQGDVGGNKPGQAPYHMCMLACVLKNAILDLDKDVNACKHKDTYMRVCIYVCVCIHVQS